MAKMLNLKWDVAENVEQIELGVGQNSKTALWNVQTLVHISQVVKQ